MRRILYLHVGPMKTGTSGIQHALKEHDNSIIIYPKVGLWHGGSHHNLVFNFFGNVPEWPGAAKADIHQLFKDIGQEARGSSLNLVISSEWLVLGERDIRAFAQGLMAHLGGPAFETEIIVVCREHFERSASLYNQRLKTGECRDPDSFLLQEAGSLCYEAMVRELLVLGYKVAALNYHPAEGCVGRFLDHIGFPQHRIPATRELNVSLTPKGLIARLAMNRAGGTNSAGDKRALLAEMPVSRGSSQFIFGARAVSKVERRFARDRQFIREKLGIELVPPPLESRANKFQIDAAELDEIARAAMSLGPAGGEIVEIARQYLRVR